MKDRLIRSLARLASTAYQEMYMVAGDCTEYVVPEDLVEDVAGLCRLAQQSKFDVDFEAPQRLALAAMSTAVAVHGRNLFGVPKMRSATQLVRDDRDWAGLRQAATDCLKSFGVNVLALRPEQIDDEADVHWSRFSG